MHIVLKLTTRTGERFDPRIAILLAWALLAALADLLRTTKHLCTNQLLPSFSAHSVTLEAQTDQTPDLFDSTETILTRLGRASALLNAAEQLLQEQLADRLIMPEARLPITVVHSMGISELLTYDETKDVIQCQAPDWAQLVTQHTKMLKALAQIAAAGLTPHLEVDRTLLNIPSVSSTLFDHGAGAGRSVISTGTVSGIYLVAGEIEIRIDGFRDGRVFRAQLSDAARLAVLNYRPPFTLALQYSETAPLLPLQTPTNGKVVIERMWDIAEQSELELS